MASSDHEEGAVKLLKVETVHTFPLNFFVENIAVRSSGGILVTVLNRNELIYIYPSQDKQEPVVLHTFSAAPSGIVEAEVDRFYVSVGTIGQRGSYAVFEVNMSEFNGDGTSAAVTKVADVPEALFLNGSALLNRNQGIILLADSIVGAVYRLQISLAKVDVWIQHKLLEKVTDNPMMPGLNGIKVYKDALYLSNTDAKTFLRAAIDGSGISTGEMELLQEKLNVDDFAFDVQGSSYLTTHVFQSVVKLREDGTRSRIAGAPGDRTCAGTTAAAFGRTDTDRTSLYVTTNGGMSYPVDGELGPARLLKIDVGHAGA
ncbi:hypothetical protein MMC07_008043 [Pseudocyphellaria aurata]|nr:hypothetical protein [Pseudocyphellaria aurata]